MRKQVREAIQYYTKELKRRFPDVEVEEMPEAMGGFDAWLQVTTLTPQSFDDVLDATAELNGECYDRFSVGILATVLDPTHPIKA
jgi:hypothetical protein